MAFEWIQKQTHTIADTTVFVSYDRFTTRFTIKSETEVIYSSWILLPVKKRKYLYPLHFKVQVSASRFFSLKAGQVEFMMDPLGIIPIKLINGANFNEGKFSRTRRLIEQ